MLPALVGFCRQSVKIAPRTGIDSWGEITYGADVTYRARVVGRRRVVPDDQGDEVISTHTVYLATPAAVGVQDRITLSTGDVYSTETGALQPPILGVAVFPDDLGRRHLALYLR